MEEGDWKMLSQRKIQLLFRINISIIVFKKVYGKML